MSSLFSNHALKQSLGVSSLVGLASLRSRSTSIASQVPQRESERSPSASDFQPSPSPESNLEQLLYEARAQAKIYASKVAMHMNDSWRRGLYRQLDSLLDIEEWLEGEVPLGTNSFATFLRLMLLVRPEVRPGLGLTSMGNLVASWNSSQSRLAVECLPGDGIRLVLSHQIDDVRESSAVDTTVDRFSEVLTPYHPEQWFARAAA